MKISAGSFKFKVAILIAVTLVFVPVTILWHSALTGYSCETKVSDFIPMSAGKSDSCSFQTNFHWIAFYSINGIIYGVPFITLVLRRNSEG